MNPKSFRKVVEWFPLVLLSLSLGFNVYLAARVRNLGRPQPRRGANIVGHVLPTLTATDVDGVQAKLEWSVKGTSTVLYVFTPTCHWCKQNLANIKHVAQIGGPTYHFIGLSLTDKGLKEYVQSANLGFPVYSGIDRKYLAELGLGSTPQTIIVSSGGRVSKSLLGAYTGRNATEIESLFHTHLPGMTTLN